MATAAPASLTPAAGPYIVYMLQEVDILEDWTAIKKVGAWPLLQAAPGEGASSRRVGGRAGQIRAGRVSCHPPWPGSDAWGASVLRAMLTHTGAGSRVPSEEESGWAVTLPPPARGSPEQPALNAGLAYSCCGKTDRQAPRGGRSAAGSSPSSLHWSAFLRLRACTAVARELTGQARLTSAPGQRPSP